MHKLGIEVQEEDNSDNTPIVPRSTKKQSANASKASGQSANATNTSQTAGASANATNTNQTAGASANAPNLSSIQIGEKEKIYDKVVKESFALFYPKLAEHFGFKGLEFGEILSTEHAEVTVNMRHSDFACSFIRKNIFGKKEKVGFHAEFQAELKKDDIVRFSGYNQRHMEMHHMPFYTVIITKKVSTVKRVITGGNLTFAPLILELKKMRASNLLAKAETNILAGKELDELDMIFAPLCADSREPAEILRQCAELVSKTSKSTLWKNKLLALMMVFSSNVVSGIVLEKIWKEFTTVENVFDMFTPLEEEYSLRKIKRLYEHQISLPTSIASEIFEVPEDKVKAIEMEAKGQAANSDSDAIRNALAKLSYDDLMALMQKVLPREE
ncbi:MAG: hypothetical protein LBT59_00175 [Clostridiales bacterium]|nr:hypothetical protein [Clostridiales bacterium]